MEVFCTPVCISVCRAFAGAFVVLLLGRGLAFTRDFGRMCKLCDYTPRDPKICVTEGIKKLRHSVTHSVPIAIAYPSHTLHVFNCNLPVMLPSVSDQ